MKTTTNIYRLGGSIMFGWILAIIILTDPDFLSRKSVQVGDVVSTALGRSCL